MAKLTALRVERERRPGYYGDGDGLWLQVTANGKSWILRYRLGGKQREMGLGSYSVLGLADARDEAKKYRRLARVEGVDPIERRREARAAQALEHAQAITFRQAAERYIDAHRTGWKNPKHAEQWPSTLKAYVYPVLGDLPVRAIDTGLVMKVLEPIWTVKPETAGRVRGRIEAILDWGRTRGHRTGENPARWRGHLEHQLTRKSKLPEGKVQHHPALQLDDVREFMLTLRAAEGLGAVALRFAILTAGRSEQVRGATWSEIDLGTKLWTIPGSRMKVDRDHRVPLSNDAVVLLEDLPGGEGPDLVFRSATGRQLSDATLGAVLKRMINEDGAPAWTDERGRAVVPHGFRSTFRDWGSERTNYPSEMLEMALAHTIDDKVEAAYRRGDMVDRRRRLMEDWARFCDAPAVEGNNVRAIGGAR